MKKIILLSLVGIALSGCSTDLTRQYELNSSSLNRSSIVQMHYDEQRIPSEALFSWSADFKGIYLDNRLSHVNMDALLKQGIVNALVKKGYRFTENATSADYTIAYTAGLERALSDKEVLQTFGAQPGLITSRKPEQNVEKGTLVVDVINQATGRLHWRSSGQALTLLDEVPLEQREQRLKQFLNLMLSDLH